MSIARIVALMIKGKIAAKNKEISYLRAENKLMGDRLNVLKNGIPLDAAKDGEWYFVRTRAYKSPIQARWCKDQEMWEVGAPAGWFADCALMERALPAKFLHNFDKYENRPSLNSDVWGAKL